MMIALALTIAAPQMHDMHGMAMPGMAMPARPAPAKAAPARKARPKRQVRKPAAAVATTACPPEHAAMGHCRPDPAIAPRPADPQPADPAMPGMAMPGATESCSPEHAAMGHCTATPADPPARAVGTDQAAGDAPAPAPPTIPAAARFYDPAVMAAADRRMRAEHGGMRMNQVIFNLAELSVRRGRDGYRWDGEGWFGGDIHRLVIRSEGEGAFGDRVDQAEVQALYARALDPYWNLQAGIRRDLGGREPRSYAALGVEGLAPYWFDVEGTVFLSDRGDVLARAEAWYDQRLTQRAILQPRIELNLAAQDMPARRIGAGLSSAELGLRLRYEIRREFAPYIGLSWERRYGATARYARGDGAATGGFALALGVRAWF